MARLRGIGLLSILVFAGACGGSPNSAVRSSAATRPPTQPGEAASTAADHALAAAAVLRLADLPKGWGLRQQSSAPDVPGLQDQLAQCLGVSASLFEKNRKTNVESPDFVDLTDEQVLTDEVGYLPTAAQAKQNVSVLSEPQAPACLSSAIGSFMSYELSHPNTAEATLPAGVTIGQVTVASLEFPKVGDDTIAYRLSIPFNVQTNQLTFYVDLVASTKGRAGTVLLLERPLHPPDESLENQLQFAVVERLAST